jgi:hypothetical protein
LRVECAYAWGAGIDGHFSHERLLIHQSKAKQQMIGLLKVIDNFSGCPLAVILSTVTGQIEFESHIYIELLMLYR